MGEPIYRKRIPLKFLFRLTVILLFCAFSAAGCLVLDLYRYAHHPAGDPGARHTINIRQGERFNLVTGDLVRHGIVTHPVKFRALARLGGYDKRIRAGEYLVAAGRTPLQILEQLVEGKVVLHRFTIPEGYTLIQIAQAVAAENLATAQDFIAAATNPTEAEKNRIPAGTFEGYLFPDTYHFPSNITAGEIVSKMVRRFWDVFTPAWQKRAEELGMTVHGIVTLASIIEKETGADHERPLIASEFWNRLKKNMRLESNPTVIYGIEGFDGNLTRKHLRTPTPYNTYINKGLPPGPIANPGAKSLEAALYPADTDYLFFVSRQDGTHQFSATYKAHCRAVRKYQLSR